MGDENKPVDTIRLGAIKAAIWQNETPVGIRHNVTSGALQGTRSVEVQIT